MWQNAAPTMNSVPQRRQASGNAELTAASAWGGGRQNSCLASRTKSAIGILALLPRQGDDQNGWIASCAFSL